MDMRDEQVVIETDRYRIQGTVTLPREGYRSRLSDFMNQRDREFVSVKDASVSPIDGADGADPVPFMMIARRHIRTVSPTQA